MRISFFRASHALRVAEESADYTSLAPDALSRLLTKLEKEMFAHARNLEFEQAAALRDQIDKIKARTLGVIEGRVRRV